MAVVISVKVLDWTAMPGPKLLYEIFKEAFKEWWADSVPRLSAAVAFYTLISLAPLLVITVIAAGFVFGQAAVQGEIVGQMQVLLSREAASVIQQILLNAGTSQSGGFAALLSVAVLLIGATAVFAELQHALNRVWEVRSAGSIKSMLFTRLLSFLMVLGIGLLLSLTLAANAALAVVTRYLGDQVPGLRHLVFLYNMLLPFAIITVLFAMFYRILPDVHISWGDVWVGALITSALFILGKYLLAYYLGRGTFSSAYGAAGSLVVFLLWIYYSTQIFFFGAELTHVYAKKLGVKITPARGAVSISERERKCETDK